jgi:hypothetical protein
MDRLLLNCLVSFRSAARVDMFPTTKVPSSLKGERRLGTTYKIYHTCGRTYDNDGDICVHIVTNNP